MMYNVFYLTKPKVYHDHAWPRLTKISPAESGQTHGANSDPGWPDDIANVLQRQLEKIHPDEIVILQSYVRLP